MPFLFQHLAQASVSHSPTLRHADRFTPINSPEDNYDHKSAQSDAQPCPLTWGQFIAHCIQVRALLFFSYAQVDGKYV